ncbi:MAG: hypothetical protein AB8B50_08520 [Pirellulaceae bacterium]
MSLLAKNKNRTATLVNAAFLQEVKDSNHELWDLLRELRSYELPKRPAKSDAAAVVRQLSELRDAVGLEFSLEETYGFVRGNPNKSHDAVEAGKAQNQHRELYLQLHELCEQAEEAQYRGTITRDLPIFMGAFDQFDADFQTHEQFENNLIESSLGGRLRNLS